MSGAGELRVQSINLIPIKLGIRGEGRSEAAAVALRDQSSNWAPTKCQSRIHRISEVRPSISASLSRAA
jgi:hypothetical protein